MAVLHIKDFGDDRSIRDHWLFVVVVTRGRVQVVFKTSACHPCSNFVKVVVLPMGININLTKKYKGFGLIGLEDYDVLLQRGIVMHEY